MCIPLTPVLYFLTTVMIEVYSLCFIESVSLRGRVKSTLRAEISSPSSLYFKAVKGAHIGSALNDLLCNDTYSLSAGHITYWGNKRKRSVSGVFRIFFFSGSKFEIFSVCSTRSLVVAYCLHPQTHVPF